jgi:hypothetical protein
MSLPPTTPAPKAHVWFNPNAEDEFQRGWWVWDPILSLPLGPFGWRSLERVTRSIKRDLAERAA